MSNTQTGVMRGLINRALFAAASVVMMAAASSAQVYASSAPVTVSAPPARLAGGFDLAVLLPSLSTGPQDLSRYATNEVSGEFALADGISLDSGVNVDIGRMLERDAPTAGAFDGLFYSAAALTSPYTSLSSGGTYIGMNLALTDSLHLAVGRAFRGPGINPFMLDTRWAVARVGGAAMPYDSRNTRSLLAGLSWNFAKWGGIGFTASQTTERDDAFYGSALPTARITALAVSAHVGLGGGWMTSASYSEGDTQLELKPNAFAGSGTLHSQSYGFVVAKKGLFGNDALGVALSHPAPGYGGGFEPATTGDLQFLGHDKLFSSGLAPETDFELGYTKNFFGNSVALQANASYQTNFGGQAGNNAVSLLSRAKIKF